MAAMFGCRMPKPLPRKASSGIARSLGSETWVGKGSARPMRFHATRPMNGQAVHTRKANHRGRASQPEMLAAGLSSAISRTGYSSSTLHCVSHCRGLRPRRGTSLRVAAATGKPSGCALPVPARAVTRCQQQRPARGRPDASACRGEGWVRRGRPATVSSADLEEQTDGYVAISCPSSWKTVPAVAVVRGDSG
jgi:hypothetical protein